MSVSDDFIFRGGHCRHGHSLWGTVKSPVVLGKYLGSRVRPFIGQGPGRLGPDHDQTGRYGSRLTAAA